jgi:anti-sigma regulatory factor (Ser/Thr protein kinase)
MTSFQRRVPARAESIPGLRGAVTDYLDGAGIADESLHWAVQLALTEAAANAVRHAYREGPGTLEVWIERDAAQVTLCVRDQGVGTAEPSPDPGLGLGMQLMQMAADTLKVDSTGAGTAVTMTFPVAGA